MANENELTHEQAAEVVKKRKLGFDVLKDFFDFLRERQ